MSYTYFWLPTVCAVSKRLKALDGKPGFDDYVAERKRVKAAAKVDGEDLGRWEVRWKVAKELAGTDAAQSRANKYGPFTCDVHLRGILTLVTIEQDRGESEGPRLRRQ